MGAQSENLRAEVSPRISDCLSTLDAQIAAEADKLAALKTHKQGLMQQLFPQPLTPDPSPRVRGEGRLIGGERGVSAEERGTSRIKKRNQAP